MRYFLEIGMPEYLEKEKRRTGLTKTNLIRKFLTEYTNVAENHDNKKKSEKLPHIQVSFDCNFGVSQETVRNAISTAMSRKHEQVDHSAEIAALDAQIEAFFKAYNGVEYIEEKEK